jgi:hypothetical protein
VVISITDHPIIPWKCIATIVHVKVHFVAEMLSWKDCDCNIAAANSEGSNALHMALAADAPSAVIHGLMLYKVDVLKANSHGKSALELAIDKSAAQPVRVIVESLDRALVNKPLPGGSTPLQYAQVIIKSLCTAQRRRCLLNTWTHLVQKAGNKDAIAALIRAGADVQKQATAMAKKALEAKDDVLLAALTSVGKQSMLDTLDIGYKRMVAAGLPKTAAAALARAPENLGM